MSHHIEPDREPGFLCPDRDQNSAVEAGTARVEDFKAGDLWIDDCGLKRRLKEFDLFKIHNPKSEITASPVLPGR
ncbi:MAG: hypothetical protein DRH50_02660 [Deltaproteobacteria bacterium]|nr:MAG: hypothetical protein DRH50_02660 [Deltaproteobacteria bacterium]